MGIFNWFGGKTKSTQAGIKSLIIALQDKDENKSKSAAMELGQVGLPAVAPLIAALRQAFIGMSPRITYDQAGAINEWDRVRGAIRRALAAIGAPAVQPLIAALKDELWGVRMQAAIILGDIGSTEAVPALQAALNDEQEFVRMMAESSLKKITQAS